MIKVGVTDYAVLDILPGDFSKYLELTKSFELDFLKSAFSKFAEIELDLKYSLNPENLFESACLRLMTSKVQVSQPIIQPTEQSQPTVPPPVNSAKKVEESSEIDKIWGNVLLKVKENNMFALVNALQNVIKVQKLANKILLTINDLGSYEMIDNPDRISVLLKTINLFDDSIEKVVVEYDKTNASTQDIKDNLRDVFKSKIKFKE